MNSNPIVDVQDEEMQTFEDASFSVVPPKDVFVYNELRSCADLVRLVDEHTLNIKPDFQRNVVWNESQQSEFIDSLVKQLPIPSMCFSLEADQSNPQRLVIDGLQRMATIHKFLTQEDWKLKRSDEISDKLAGKTVHKIKEDSPEIYKLVENTTIPVTIVRCDTTKADHLEYLFIIFHRLNKGGVRLYNQEIRNCIYTGNFNSLLKAASKNEDWRKLYGIKQKRIDRMRDEELVLRFFAFSEGWETYDGHLSKFLNEYMRVRRKLSEEALSKMKECFETTMSLVSSKLNFDAFKAETISLKETVLVGISRNLNKLKNTEPEEVQKMFLAFKAMPSVDENYIKEGVTKKKKVLERMEDSVRAFS